MLHFFILALLGTTLMSYGWAPVTKLELHCVIIKTIIESQCLLESLGCPRSKEILGDT